MSVGTTSELYLDPDQKGAVPANPPPSPAPPAQPVVVTQPAVTKSRMADETPDGKVRDTSMEAVSTPSKDLGFRNITDESENAPKPPADAKPSEKVPETAPVVPKTEQTPAEKVYAGKFKSVEELEKGYEEAQKLITRQGQEKAELQKKVEQPPAPPPVKTPQQIAAEEAEKNQFLEKFVADPKGVITKFQEEAAQQTQIALTTQQIRNEWIKSNPDLAKDEPRVAFEMALLAQSDPDLARNPAALLNKATENFRQFTGRLRTEGAKEALTTETRVIPLLSNTAPATATEQPAKAPQTSGDVVDAHVRWLKEQEQRSHRGLRR